MDRFNNKKDFLVVSKMFYHMGKMFEDNIPFKHLMLGKIDGKFKRS